MLVKIIDEDNPGHNTYVELTQEQYDKFKGIEKEHKYLANANLTEDQKKELFKDQVAPPKTPSLIWYR